MARWGRLLPPMLSGACSFLAGAHVELEYFLDVIFEDHLLLRGTEPIEGFDQMPRLVQPLAGFGIFHRSDAWALGAEQTSVGANRLDEQGKRIARVQHGVVVQLAHAIGETLGTGAPQR